MNLIIIKEKQQIFLIVIQKQFKKLVRNIKNLQNILIVVTRYFGGIKLGAGGLLRAYSSGANNVIKK